MLKVLEITVTIIIIMHYCIHRQKKGVAKFSSVHVKVQVAKFESKDDLEESLELKIMKEPESPLEAEGISG